MRNEKEVCIGYVEMALGVGDMIGPAVGSFIYAFAGFAGTFLLFSAIIFLGIVFSVIMIPQSLNIRSDGIRQTSSSSS